MAQHSALGQLDFSARTPAQEQLFILSRAVQQSPNAILIARANGVIQYINPSFTKLTGFTPEEVLGRPSVSLGEGVAERYKGLRGVLREGREWKGEVKGKKKDGEIFWAQENINPIFSPEGKITHFLVILQDITQQKTDRQALEESEHRFRQVSEMTGEWLWEQDAEGRYLYSSAAVQDILGYRPEDMVGKSYLEFLPTNERVKEATQLPALLEQGLGFCRLLNCYLHRDGHRVYTESTGAPLRDRKGRVLKWRGVDHNITARKRQEDELRLRNRALEAASVGICILDAAQPGFPVIYANSAMCRISGYSQEEWAGQELKRLQGPDTDPTAQARIADALAHERECEVTLKHYRKDGSPFWNELSISPVRDETGQLSHYIAIQADVTERISAEAQRRELDFAREIQLSLLPKAPLSLPTAQVAGQCVPASHVGGDYFDYFRVHDCLDIVIADVSGHGVGSALIMAEVRSLLKAEVCRVKNGSDHGPGQTLATLNQLLYDDLDGADLFISMFYLRYEPRNRRLRYANAGHNPPLLLRDKAPACELLDAEGMILGVEKEMEFEEKSLMLTPGDRLLLYTDGIVEARNLAGEFFGARSLCRLFSTYRPLPPRDVVKSILVDLLAFSSGAAHQDDVTLIVAEFT